MNDDKLKELFRAARHADEANAPDFDSVRRAAPSGRRVRFGAAVLTGAATAAVAFGALWLAVAPESAPDVRRTIVEPVRPQSVPRVAEPELDPVPSPAAEAETDTAPPSAPPQDTARPAPREEIVATAEPRPAPPSSPNVPARETRRTTPAIEKAADAPRPVAAGGTGGLDILVRDSMGPLPGATVHLAHEDGWVRSTSVVTNKDGRAEFPVLRAGPGYVIEVAFAGMMTQRLTDQRVTLNDKQTVEVALQTELVETVTVAGAGDIVDLDETQTSASFRKEFVADLPIAGRFYQNVLTLAPGAQDADGDGNPNVHGSRDRDFKAIVGGISNVEPLTGQHGTQANPNSIEEMEVVTANSGIEYSRAQGGFANIVERREPPPERPGTPPPPMLPAAESYDSIDENGFRSAADEPLSTFSIDVDSASYANVRRFLNAGQLPPADAVRIEELINYFDYDDPAPTGKTPFSTTVEVVSAPWNPDHRLARIGLRGRDVERGETEGSNLVFLVDVSGSMRSPDKLPLLKQGLQMLADQLDGRDRVAMVVYAGSSGVVLPPTPGSDRTAIREAIGRLEAGGSTNGGAGLKLAYRLARENFIPGGINRVLLATDGDFNVGVTGNAELLDIVKKDADAGVFLTVLGFGTGNLADDRLERISNRGNGNYAYIDSAAEARRVLVEQINGTLVTIAKDVKIQVEFNPARVAGYRLIGYENRMLAARDFNDDTKDAGEIGAGHTVTALYEIVPAGRPIPGGSSVDPLRYAESAPTAARDAGDPRGRELFHLKLRYKEPDGTTSRLIEAPVIDDGRSIAAATPDTKFAASVALFGMLLRGSEFAGDGTFDDAVELAVEGRGRDVGGHRGEFRTLIDRARALRQDAER